MSTRTSAVSAADFTVVVAAPEGDAAPALRSVARQSPPPAAVVLVTGDGPAPGAADVRLVRAAPGAAGDACTAAARAARTPYVAFLQGRDEVLPGWLEQLARAAAEDAALIECGVLRLRESGLIDGIALPPEVPGGADVAYAVRRDLLGEPDGPVRGGGRYARVTVPRLLVRRRTGEGAATGAAARAARADVLRAASLGSRAAEGDIEPPRPGRRPELVSVVLPVRDGALTLPAQLDALGRQTYEGPWEVLVVDNGSADGTREVARAARAVLPALRIVDARDRAGESHARNRGTAEARGDLIAFCDADDVAAEGWLAALAAAAPDAALIGGSLDTTLLSPAHADEQPLPMTAQTDFLPFARGANCAAWKEVLDAVGGWDENYVGGGEDMDLSWRVRLSHHRLGYAPDARMHYRLRAELSSLARQKWNYGRSGARLYDAYRHAGFRRRDGATVLMNWSWLLLHSPDLARSPGLRRRWVRYGARLAGFLAGSVEQGVAYL
ncbi:glycosyltransferase [Streptomyces sp. PsTaAH-124]|uniref:glycosyltransferase n=1 Tax=Streptomyces sp. PsTaAH-124 TaxID=1157638 RepID=UPI001F370E27|nr:glycosyltransferase [Streptomyces sp. PsTaAH-124]